MININLLPDKEKKIMSWDAWRRLILILTAAILGGLVIFSAILVGANLYFLKSIEETALLLSFRRQLPSGLELQTIEEKLAAADQKINQISKIRAQISPKGFIFTEIISMLPEGCRLVSFRLKKENLVELTGFASERSQLRSFKKTLENNDKISNLNFPLANLLKEKDIEFTLSFKISQ